jgi:hypothetical protein
VVQAAPAKTGGSILKLIKQKGLGGMAQEEL